MKRQIMRKNPSAKSASNKLKMQKTSCLTPVSAWAHVVLSICNAWPSGYISRSKNKSSVVPNITTLRNLSVKSAKLNSPWLLISQALKKNFFPSKSPKETISFYKEHVTKKKASSWSKISPMKESSSVEDISAKSELQTFPYPEITAWSRIRLMDSTFTTISPNSER